MPFKIQIICGGYTTAQFTPGTERSTVFVHWVWEQFYDTLFYYRYMFLEI